MTCKYVVKPGDSFWEIAEKELGDGSKWQDIAKLNNLSRGTCLRPGQELQLPCFYYVIKPGDSLLSIANQSTRFASELAKLNGCRLGSNLKIGQCVRVPLGLATPKMVVEGYSEYIVQNGDTLTSIAKKKLGTTNYKPIADLNQLTPPYKIYPGKKLKIPSTGRKVSSLSQSFKSKQDENVRSEVQRKIKELIPDGLDKKHPTLGEKLEQAKQIYIKLLTSIPWLEGAYRYMYLDKKGLVTIGLGYNVDNLTTLKELFKRGDLDFYLGGDPNKKVSDFEEVKKTYQFVKKQVKGKHGKDYFNKKYNNLLIPGDQMLVVSKSHLDRYVIGEIKKEYPNLSKISNGSPPPIAALVGMIDKVYNAGMAKLLAPANKKGFPKFIAAFREGDFVMAAKESANGLKKGEGGIAKRNTLDYELFMAAVRAKY